MIYLTIFWIIVSIFFIIYSVGRYFKIEAIQKCTEEYGSLLFIISLSFVVIAIVTKNPISLLGIEFPMQLQWLVSLIVSAFGAWQFYLNPLKERVITTEKDVSSIKTDICSIKSNMQMLKDHLETDVHSLKDDFHHLREDFRIVQQHIIK